MKIGFEQIQGVQLQSFSGMRPVHLGVAELESVPATVRAEWRVDVLPFGETTGQTVFDTFRSPAVANILVPRQCSPQILVRDVCCLLDDISGFGKGTSVRIDLDDRLAAQVFSSEMQSGIHSIIGGVHLFAGRPSLNPRVEPISEVLIALGPEALAAFEASGGFAVAPTRAATHISFASILT